MSENTGSAPQTPDEQPSHDAVPELEVDETVPPRPEEEIADAG
jgi:hypothetical protein